MKTDPMLEALVECILMDPDILSVEIVTKAEEDDGVARDEAEERSECCAPRGSEETLLSETEFGQVYHTNAAFYHLLHEMARLHNAKQHDYCGAGHDPVRNLRASAELGIEAWKGTLIRMADKWARIRNFALAGTLAVEDESFVDTCLDLAVYSLHVINLFKEATGALDATD